MPCIDSTEGYLTGCGTFPPDFEVTQCPGCELHLPTIDGVHYRQGHPFLCCFNAHDTTTDRAEPTGTDT